MVDRLDSSHPEFSFQIRNLQAVIFLTDDITPAQQVEPNLRTGLTNQCGPSVGAAA